MRVADKWERVALLKRALDGFDHIPKQDRLIWIPPSPGEQEREERIRKIIEQWLTSENGLTRETFLEFCWAMAIPPEDIRRAARV